MRMYDASLLVTDDPKSTEVQHSQRKIVIMWEDNQQTELRCPVSLTASLLLVLGKKLQTLTLSVSLSPSLSLSASLFVSRLEDQLVAYSWHKILHLVGNPSRISQPENHLLAVVSPSLDRDGSSLCSADRKATEEHSQKKEKKMKRVKKAMRNLCQRVNRVGTELPIATFTKFCCNSGVSMQFGMSDPRGFTVSSASRLIHFS